MEMSPPAAIASMKALVPDLAIVPKLLMSSFLVMPMPESSMVNVEFVLSGTILGARSCCQGQRKIDKCLEKSSFESVQHSV